MKKILVLLLVVLSATTYAQKIESISPPNWWIGMRDSTVQLMIHGKNIGTATLTIDYPGVTILSTSAVENPNYLFAEIIISKKAAAGKIPLQFSMAKLNFTHEYEIFNRTQRTSAYGLDAGDFIYLLMPDRFANGDINNDVIATMKETTVDRDTPKG